MKVTKGITASFCLRVLIDDRVSNLDVELLCPGGAAASKGWTVCLLKVDMIELRSE